MAIRVKVLVLLAAALLLVGCAATSIPEFDAPQTERDMLPADAVLSDIDPGSTRYVGDVEGAEVYLARADGDQLCVIQLRGGQPEQMGCGAGMGIGTTLPSGTMIEAGSFRFPADQVEDATREQVSPSVTIVTP